MSKRQIIIPNEDYEDAQGLSRIALLMAGSLTVSGCLAVRGLTHGSMSSVWR
jgi:hypothetical protein